MGPRRGPTDASDAVVPRVWSPRAVGVVLVAIAAITYPLLSERTGQPLAMFALPPLVVATLTRPRPTLEIGGLAIVAAAIEGGYDHRLSPASLAVRLAIIAAAVVLGTLGSQARVRREGALSVATATSTELRDQLQAMSSALRAGRIGTWSWNAEDDAVTWDADLERLFGLAPGTFEGTFAGWIGRVHEDDRARCLALLEDAAAVGGSFSFEHRCVWPDGSIHWLEGVGQTLADASGVIGAAGVTADIDDRRNAEDERRRALQLERRAAERSGYLAAASQALSSALDVGELVERITASAVPALADWCRLTLLLDDGEATVRTAVAHPDPEVVALTRWLEVEHPFRADATTGAARVSRTGETVFQPVIDDAMIDATFRNPALAAVLKRLDMRSVITVALRNPRGVVGSLQLVRTADSPVYDLNDVVMAEELATTIGVALHNAQLFRRQRDARAALDVLEKFSGVLARAVTVDDIVDASIVHGMSGLRADAALLYLAHGDELRLSGHAGYAAEITERWGTVPRDATTPAGDALCTGAPVVLGSGADLARRYPSVEVHHASLIALPLVIRRVDAGSVVFAFDEARRFSDEELAMLSTLAARCAGAIERARLYEAQRDASLTLQRRMLPELPPPVPWLRVAGHYQPATGGEVGGDWYQLIHVTDGTAVAVLGDAVGRGIPAAAAMGQLRGVITGAAAVDADPTRVIDAADRFARLGSDTVAASMTYVRIDPAAGRIDHLSAGHLPPVVLRADGTVELLETGRRPLLGVVEPTGFDRAAHTAFAPGDTLVLYSDGLVERRTETIDDGLAGLCRLLGALAAEALEPQELCDRIVRDLAGADAVDDDVAVLVARRVS